MYDKQGRLTREAAVAIIQSGGSVCFAGHIYSSVANLPGEAAFAQGDPNIAKASRERLLAQRREMDAELERLDGVVASAPAAPGQPLKPLPTPTLAGEDALEKMTTVNLRELAKQEGVSLHGSLSREGVIEAIRTHRESKANPQG